ncbi:MAG: hypothetical protein PHC30_05300, partial [Lentisphaeria bacterium]|nr:hypothetical protein [Lentisphaeria bacterium]
PEGCTTYGRLKSSAYHRISHFDCNYQWVTGYNFAGKLPPADLPCRDFRLTLSGGRKAEKPSPPKCQKAAGESADSPCGFGCYWSG